MVAHAIKIPCYPVMSQPTDGAICNEMECDIISKIGAFKGPSIFGTYTGCY